MLNYYIGDRSLILPTVSYAVVVGTTTQTTCNPGIVTTTIPLIATTISGFVVFFLKYFYKAGILSAKAVKREQESTDLFLLEKAKKIRKGQIVGNEICPFLIFFMKI